MKLELFCLEYLSIVIYENLRATVYELAFGFTARQLSVLRKLKNSYWKARQQYIISFIKRYGICIVFDDFIYFRVHFYNYSTAHSLTENQTYLINEALFSLRTNYVSILTFRGTQCYYVNVSLQLLKTHKRKSYLGDLYSAIESRFLAIPGLTTYCDFSLLRSRFIFNTQSYSDYLKRTYVPH